MCSDLQRAIVQAFNASSNVHEMAVNLDMLHPEQHLDLTSICRAYKAPDMLSTFYPQIFKVSGVLNMKEAFKMKRRRPFALPCLVTPVICKESWDNMEIITVGIDGSEIAELFFYDDKDLKLSTWEFIRAISYLANVMHNRKSAAWTY